MINKSKKLREKKLILIKKDGLKTLVKLAKVKEHSISNDKPEDDSQEALDCLFENHRIHDFFIPKCLEANQD